MLCSSQQLAAPRYGGEPALEAVLYIDDIRLPIVDQGLKVEWATPTSAGRDELVVAPYFKPIGHIIAGFENHSAGGPRLSVACRLERFTDD